MTRSNEPGIATQPESLECSKALARTLPQEMLGRLLGASELRGGSVGSLALRAEAEARGRLPPKNVLVT